jgi:2,5-furandicarboxylate decarboxylase 1
MADAPALEPDLRSHLSALEAAGERIVHVARPVSPDRELTSIVKLLEPRGNPVVFFENVEGSDMPVVSSVNGTRERIALAMGCSPAEATDRYIELLANPIPVVEIDAGPVKDVVLSGDDVDLNRLPIITHAAHDSGPFLSSGVGLSTEPESGAVNAGIYRMGLKDRNHLTVNADARGDLNQIVRRRAQLGLELDFVVVIGHHPALMIGSQAKIPTDQDTLAITGAVLRQPLAMTCAETVDALVPARAEIVLEGRFLGTETEREGPFGEFPYYYSTDEGFIFEVTAITHRRDALFQDVHNVHPEHRNIWIVPNGESQLLTRLRRSFDNVRACHILSESAGMHACFSIEQRFEGEARRALMLALGSTPHLKKVTAVDPDIDVLDAKQVEWAVATRSQPDRDWFVVPYAMGYGADPSSYSLESRVPRGGRAGVHDNHALTSVVGIDATVPVQTPYAERADVVPPQYADIDVDEILRDAG